MARRPTRGWIARSLTKDKVIFLVGLVGAVNEIFVRHGPERPTIIALLVGMMGLPAFLRWDDSRGSRRNDVDKRDE